MHALMNLPNANNNITSLRTLCDVIENHVRGLAALGQSTECYGALLFPMVLGKLPAEVRKNLAREHSNLEWMLDQLRDSIVKEIRVIEAGASVSPPQPEDHYHSTASFHTEAISRPEQRKPPRCAFCKGSHPATQCDAIPDQSKRMDIVKLEKLCFNCLGHHRVSQCLATVNVARNDTTLVYAEEHLTLRFHPLIVILRIPLQNSRRLLLKLHRI